MLFHPGKILLCIAVFQHCLIIADQPELRHTAVGFGIPVPHIGVEIGMNPAFSHMDMPDFFADGNNLAGSFVPQHRGEAPGASFQSASDDLHISAITKAAGMHFYQGFIITGDRFGDVADDLNVIRPFYRNCPHIFHSLMPPNIDPYFDS